jgi:hypothetical protein
MSHLTPIYAVWDHNAEAMASDIGEPGVKVRQWRNRGNIPPIYWQRIIDAGAKKGANLKLSQFIRPRSDRPDWELTDQEIAAIPGDARVVICDVCERALDGTIPNACTYVDCPHAGRSPQIEIAA